MQKYITSDQFQGVFYLYCILPEDKHVSWNMSYRILNSENNKKCTCDWKIIYVLFNP